MPGCADHPRDGALRRQVECNRELGVYGPVEREFRRTRKRVLHAAARHVGENLLGVGIRALDPDQVRLLQTQILERALVHAAGGDLDHAA